MLAHASFIASLLLPLMHPSLLLPLMPVVICRLVTLVVDAHADSIASLLLLLMLSWLHRIIALAIDARADFVLL